MVVQCIWFKRDLRIHDHAALQAAAKKGPVIAVYVLEPAILQAPDFDALHWNFIADSLRDLQHNLSHMGLELIIRFGDALSILQALHTQYAFKAIWAHQETGNAISYRRDLAVHQWARDRGIAFYEPAQNGVVRRLAHRGRWSRQWEAFMSAPISRLGQRACGVFSDPNCERIRYPLVERAASCA
jgi:deoxyribodipyrimidine photo-lyase